MKKVYLVTLCTCLVVIAFVSASVYFLRDEEKEITVGFVYVGDASTAYTSNFIDAQEAIQTKYGDQVKVIALNNVAEGTEREYLQQLVDAGCDLIFTTSYNYGTVTKEFAEKYPGIEFCMATCANANEEPLLKNYHTFMGKIYQGRYTASGSRDENERTDQRRRDHRAAGKDRICCSLSLCGGDLRIYGIFARSEIGCTGSGDDSALYQ